MSRAFARGDSMKRAEATRPVLFDSESGPIAVGV
jgi:hypothetical protein